MHRIAFILFLFSTSGYGQWKAYKLTQSGDTINRVDTDSRKQGPWLNQIAALRGEPGYEEEGEYRNNRKEGEWRMYNLQGDLIAVENYRWGLRDGRCRYFTADGALKAEQSWKALDPDKEFDTVEVEDPDHPDTFRRVPIRNEGASIKHGLWKYYNTISGMIIREESYELGKQGSPLTTPSATQHSESSVAPKVAPKPREVLEFEKKNEGKKKVRVRDGSTGG